MTEVHSIGMHNNWRSQCGWEGSGAIPGIGERWLSQAGWSTFLHFKCFFLYLWVVFCFIGVFLFLVLRLFHLSWGCKVRLLAVLHTAFPDGAVLCCRLFWLCRVQSHFSTSHGSWWGLWTGTKWLLTHQWTAVGLPEAEDVFLVSFCLSLRSWNRQRALSETISLSF